MSTTTQERAVRVKSLAHDAIDSDALQGLLEFAARIVIAGGEGDLPAGAFELADQIAATFEPEAPVFEVGDQVGYPRPTGKAGVMGRVKERYLNEHGDWEYQIRFNDGSGQAPFAQGDLQPPIPFDLN